MSIKEGYEAVVSAAGGNNYIGKCDRCKRNLISGWRADGNCQSPSTYIFRQNVERREGHTHVIYNGACIPNMTVSLCDQCAYAVRDFINGKTA